jgi:hypothetical protein
VLERARRVALAALLLGGCSAPSSDTDESGTLDTDPGTDVPPGLDSDGDGLTDVVELSIGTSVDDVDSDDDTYSDRDEHHEGSDPLDAADRIYQGGWPYYFEKTELTGGTTYAVDERFGDFRFEDQFGDRVALWDFYDDTVPVIVELGGGWCLACADLAAWLEGAHDPDLASYDAVRDAVVAGRLRWITVMGEDYVPGQAAQRSTIDQWVATFPNDQVPVLLDTSYTTALFVDATVWPTLTLLDPDLTVDTMTSLEHGYLPVLAAASAAVQ